MLTPLAKAVLIPLWLTAAASATDAAIQKEIFGLETTALIKISKTNKEIEDIMKIVKYLEESGLLTKGVSEKIKYEAK